MTAVEKRRRAAALQDAGARTAAVDERGASWSAPVLWRFVKREKQRERELTNDKIYGRKTEKHLEKIVDRPGCRFRLAGAGGRRNHIFVAFIYAWP